VIHADLGTLSRGGRNAGRHADFFARPTDDPLTVVAGERL
jgi:hypothetical protein